MANPSEKYYEKLKQKTTKSRKTEKSYSSDNLALDYDLFITEGSMTNKKKNYRSISESGNSFDSIGSKYSQKGF